MLYLAYLPTDGLKPVMSKTTKIADSDIAIEPGQPIAIRFSGGRQGKSEAGVYEFWTIFNNTDKPVTGRSLQGTDPGERFRRMQGARGYEQYWKVAATAIAIRPATQEEVLNWLQTHGDDALFAESCKIGEKTLKVSRTIDGFGFYNL